MIPSEPIKFSFSYLPESGGHGEEAEDEVGDGERHDEDVPGGAHAVVPQHRPDDHHVPQQARHQQHHVRHHQEPKIYEVNTYTSSYGSYQKGHRENYDFVPI